MKKMFFFASLLLAAVTLNSCSQDSDLAADEAATAAAGALTPEQKAQIMELAEYYGLDVMIDERPTTRSANQPFHIDSIEVEFRRIAALKGEYKCVRHDSTSAVFEKESVESARPLRLTRTLGETYSGSFSDIKSAQGYWIRVDVSWSWSITAPGRLDVGVYVEGSPYDLSRESFEYAFYGMQPSFTFTGKYKLWDMYTNKIYTRLKVTGYYSDGYGTVSVS